MDIHSQRWFDSNKGGVCEMINFATLQGLTIPEGVVTQIARDGVVLWKLSGDKIILEVAKVTSETYAGETSYSNEEFILLDIYPKTNGTVTVTYGGLTKTITDTSGAEKPNAQKVFFGTFNGVSDSIVTPPSGTLTIEGDCYGFGWGTYARDNSHKKSVTCCCVTAIEDVGNVIDIPASAFFSHALSINKTALKKVILKNGVESIGEKAFAQCTGLEQMTIPASVKSIPYNTWADRVNNFTMNGTFLSIDKDNPNYYYEGSCVITKADNKMICGFSDAVIPNGVKIIGNKACYYTKNMTEHLVIPEGVKTIEAAAFKGTSGITDITIPSSVTNIEAGAFYGIEKLARVVVLASTPPTVIIDPSENYIFTLKGSSSSTKPVSITVPKGSGSAYKSATGWKDFADIIVEAS